MTRDNAYLYDILESAKLALEQMGNAPRDEFEKDILLQDAVVRRLEIIGEATRRISTETKPWQSQVTINREIATSGLSPPRNDI